MIRKYGLFAIWVLATVASFASLYFTEIAVCGICPLVWLERICLFPLITIAGMAAWYGFYGIATYLLPLTFIGTFISLYHLLLLYHVSWIGPFPGCAIEATTHHLHEIISFVAFLLINALLIGVWRHNKRGLYDKI